MPILEARFLKALVVAGMAAWAGCAGPAPAAGTSGGQGMSTGAGTVGSSGGGPSASGSGAGSSSAGSSIGSSSTGSSGALPTAGSTGSSGAAGGTSGGTGTAVPDAVVTIDLANATPLPPGFSGFNFEPLDSAVELYDPNFAALAETLNPGWLRFPAGAESDSFDWQTGDLPQAWIDEFGDAGMINSSLSYEQFFQECQTIDRGKGLTHLGDYAALARQLGADTVICVNGFTDTAASAGGLAAAALDAGLIAPEFELANEPYYFETTFFAGLSPGKTYLDDMAPYAAAIQAANPAAAIAVFVRDTSDPWNTAVGKYASPYWDMSTVHIYPLSILITGFTATMEAANDYVVNQAASVLATEVVPYAGDGGASVTEFSPSVNPTEVIHGTMYEGVFLVEWILRAAALPGMRRVGVHDIYDPNFTDFGMIRSDDDNLGAVEAAAADGGSIDTATLNFGFYVTAPGLALGIANAAINGSTGLLATTLTGGTTAPTASATVPALYAQALVESSGAYHLILTNKSGSSQTVGVQIANGPAPASFTVTELSSSNPQASTNTPPHDQLTPATIAVSGTVLTLGPYSVTRADW